MRKLDFFGSVFLVIFSLVSCREAYRLSLGKPRAPGPGLYPFLLGSLLLILSIAYLFKTLRSWRREDEIHLWEGLRWRKVILVLSLLFAYALLLESGGFVLCTFFLLMSLLRWVDRQRWYWVYAGSLGIDMACYVVFKLWLMIQLPRGILGI
jgi:putative tricarboxylic transport membrane protein